MRRSQGSELAEQAGEAVAAEHQLVAVLAVPLLTVNDRPGEHLDTDSSLSLDNSDLIK